MVINTSVLKCISEKKLFKGYLSKQNGEFIFVMQGLSREGYAKLIKNKGVLDFIINQPGIKVEIDSLSFNAYDALNKVIIPPSVIKIGKKTFKETGLKEIVFSNRDNLQEDRTNLLSIQSEAFTDNKCLTEVTVPHFVTDISSSAFGNCKYLHEVNFEGKNTKIIKDEVSPKQCSLLKPGENNFVSTMKSLKTKTYKRK